MADSLREHEQVDELLNAYLDGELGQDEHSRVRRHLAGCDMCQAELDSLRLTKHAVQALPFLRAPRPFTLEEVTGEVPGAAPPVPRPSGAEEGHRPVSPPIPDRQPVAPNWAARLGLIWRVSSVAAAACALLFALQMAMPASEPPAASSRGIDLERPAPGAAATAPQAAESTAQQQAEGQAAGQTPGARAPQAPQEGPSVALKQATRSGPQPTPAGAMADAVQRQAPGAKGRATDSAEQRPVLGGDAGRPLSRVPWPPDPAAVITLSLTGLFGLVALVAFAAERRRRRLLP